MRKWWLAAALALGISSAAPAAWQQASSRHFIVYSDDDPEEVRSFATTLERFDKAMRVMRSMDDPPFSPTQRVTVYVLRDVGALQRLVGDRNIAGVYMPRISGPVAFVPRTTRDRSKLALTPQAVLLHEYAHHFMFSAWGERPFPAWFVEGFAEFNATMVFETDRLLIGAPPLYRAYGLIDDAMLPMRGLLTRSPQSGRMQPDQTQVFYGRSWLLTHYLLLNAERRPLLRAYLDALGEGKDLKTAAALLGDHGKLDTALNRYARARLPILGLSIDKLPIQPVTVRALGAGEAAIMPVMLRSTRGVDAKTAPGVAADARKIAAAWPNDPAVQTVLAEAEYDAGQFEAADAAAARALAGEPGQRHALVYRGMAQAALAHRAHVTDARRWKDIRAWYRQANRNDPEDPWPLVLFYHAYGASGEAMTENAEQGLAYAFGLAPWDRGLAMQVAAMYLSKKRWDDAKPALRRIAYDPHGEEAAAMAATLLTAINAKDTNVLENAVTALTAKDDAAEK